MTYDWTFEAAGLMAAVLPAAGWMAGRAYSRLRRGRPSQNAQISYDDGTLAHAEISSIIADTQSLVDDAIDRASNLPAATEAVQEEINSIIATVQEVSEMTSLLEAAVAAGGMGAMMGSSDWGSLYFETGDPFDGDGYLYILELRGDRGVTRISISSGSRQVDIIDAINAMSEKTGVHASQNRWWRDLIQLSPTDSTHGAFVRARKIQGSWRGEERLLDENRENPADRQKSIWRPE